MGFIINGSNGRDRWGAKFGEAGSQTYLVSDSHGWSDENIAYDDYGNGNGGYQQYIRGEWDWFLEIDWKHLNHGVTCKCFQCRKYFKPVRDAARAWAIRNRVVAERKRQETALIHRATILRNRKQYGVGTPKKMTNADIDKRIAELVAMKTDEDVMAA